MQTLAQIAIYIINTLGTIYLFILLLRFLFQLVRADYYNPISRVVVKATNPILVPLRKIIPGFLGVDWACVVLALTIKITLLQILMLIDDYGWQSLFLLFIAAVLSVIKFLVYIYFFGLIITVIASWVAPYSSNPGLSLLRQLIEPVVRPVRRILPDMGGLDFSPLIIFMILNIFLMYVIPGFTQGLGPIIKFI